MPIQETIIMVAAVAAAVMVIGTFSRKIYKVVNRIDSALGVDREGRTLSDRLSRVEHQLFPNGGSSLTDKINRMEADQKTLQGQVQAMERILATILRRLDKDES
jgi:outer membrane murein-binding lipoprotein Lpp